MDIDDVLCQFFQGYLEFAEPIVGKKELKDITSEYLWEVLPIDKTKAFKIADDFCYSKEFPNISLVDGAKDGIAKLVKDHEVVFITSRPSHLAKITKDFLIRHFVKDPVVFHAGNYHGGNKYKHEICLDQGIDLIFEDSGLNAGKCALAGIPVVLFDKPWNQSVNHYLIRRVDSWADFLAKGLV